MKKLKNTKKLTKKPTKAAELKSCIELFAGAKTLQEEAASTLKDLRGKVIALVEVVDPDRSTEKSRMYRGVDHELTVTSVTASPSPDLERARSVLNDAKFKLITRTVEVIDENKLIVAHEDGKISDDELAKILIKKRADSVVLKVKAL